MNKSKSVPAALDSLNRRMLCCMYPIGLIFSFCWITGRRFYSQGAVSWADKKMYLWILLGSVICTVVLCLAVALLQRMKQPGSRAGRLDRICAFNWKSIGIVTVILLIFWIPAFLAVFPGIYAYDAQDQVRQILVKHQISSHHPVIHTLFLNGVLQLGNLIFGDYNAGLVLHSIIQAVLMGIMEAYACCYLKKLKAPNWFVLMSILFMAVNPYNQIMVFSTTKDILFGGLFLIFILKCIDMLVYTEAFMEKKSTLLQWCAVCIFMCLLRKQGIYILICCTPFFCLALKKYWRRIVPMMLGCILFYGVITGPVYSMCGIAEGDFREALCIPMQQMARAVTSPTANITKEEQEMVYKLIPKKYLDQYQANSADPVKSGFQTEVLKADLSGYARVYFSIGMKNKKDYLDAIYGTAYSNWYPGHVELNIFYDGSFMEQAEELLGIKRSSLFPQYDEYLRSICRDSTISNIPVISFFLSEAGPFWILLFAGAYGIYRKKYKGVLVLLPVLGYWGTVVLGPVTLMRYSYPLMLLLPLMGAMTLYLFHERT